MFILNLGYLFRFDCLMSEAARIEDYMEDTVQKAEMLQSPRCIKSSATAAFAGATLDSQTQGKIS